MVVVVSDGVVVAASLMEGIKGNTLAALAASLAGRVASVTESAGCGTPRLFHLQAGDGALFAAPGGADLLLVMLAGPEVPLGLARLELLRVAERLA